MTAYLATLPSPTQAVWYLGPFPLRAYAIAILLGIVAAIAITEWRLRERGAPRWFTLDIAVWAVPFGILGGRIYHVITSPENYFGAEGRLVNILKIYEGGLGIWGAVALGAVGAWIACRRAGLPLTFFADALAPGLPVAQAVGRLGNWFNNEVYGAPTDLPWGLTVYEMNLATGRAGAEVAGGPFHPTFLYELLWNLGVAALILLVDRRYKLGRGRAFALYIMGYTAGRFWIELLRIDEANIILGLRVNTWVSALVFLGALAYFVRVRGPQEHLAVVEDGSLRLVTADGTPIEWRRWTALDRAETTAGTATAGKPAVGAAAAGKPAPGKAGTATSARAASRRRPTPRKRK